MRIKTKMDVMTVSVCAKYVWKSTLLMTLTMKTVEIQEKNEKRISKVIVSIWKSHRLCTCTYSPTCGERERHALLKMIVNKIDVENLYTNESPKSMPDYLFFSPINIEQIICISIWFKVFTWINRFKYLMLVSFSWIHFVARFNIFRCFLFRQSSSRFDSIYSTPFRFVSFRFVHQLVRFKYLFNGC